MIISTKTAVINLMNGKPVYYKDHNYDGQVDEIRIIDGFYAVTLKIGQSRGYQSLNNGRLSNKPWEIKQ